MEGSRIESVEKIDLATDTAANTLTLSAKDVNDASGMNQFNSSNGWTGLAANVAMHQMVVDGTSADHLNLVGTWTNAGTATNGGHTYSVLNHASTNTQVLVDNTVIVGHNTGWTVPQVQALTAADVAALTVGDIASWDAPLMAALSVPAFAQLNSTHFGAITAAGAAGISAAQFNTINKDPAMVELTSLSTAAVQALQPEVIVKSISLYQYPESVLAKLSATQIAAIEADSIGGSNGSAYEFIFGSSGNDSVTLTNTGYTQYLGMAGDDVVNTNGTAFALVNAGGGNNVITAQNSSLMQVALGADSVNTIHFDAASPSQTIYGQALEAGYTMNTTTGDTANNVAVFGGSLAGEVITGVSNATRLSVYGSSYDDTITVGADSLLSSIDGGMGNDTINVQAGYVGTMGLVGSAGSDTYNLAADVAVDIWFRGLSAENTPTGQTFAQYMGVDVINGFTVAAGASKDALNLSALLDNHLGTTVINNKRGLQQ